jgi:hypothetical protein
MLKHLICAGICATALALNVSSGRAGPPTAELLNKLPENTNSIVVINVLEIIKTPRGVREGWGKNNQQVEFLAGAIPIYPSVERVVIGSQFEPHSPGKSWYAGLIALNKPVSMEKLAERHQSTVEDLGGDKAVFSQRVGYLVRFSDDLLGVMGSNDRQTVSRWIRAAKASEKPTIAFYLRQAAAKHPTAHIFMAIDTDDLINPKGLRLALLESTLFQGNDKLREYVERYIARLRGVRFVAQIGDQIRGKFILDSPVEATKDLEVLKPFFIERLTKIGAELEDLTAASITMQDTSVILELNLSDSDLMKIMSVMSSPLLNPNPEDVETLKLSPDGVSVPLSMRYYQSVNKILDDLVKQNKKATDYTKAALWQDMYAKKIGQLSVLHVDKDVLRYGADVAGRLHATADSLRGVPIQVDKLEGQVYWMQSGGWGLRWWGGGNIDTNIPQVQLAQIDVIKKDDENRKKLWEQIDNERASIRSKMAERYKVDFDAPIKRP